VVVAVSGRVSSPGPSLPGPGMAELRPTAAGRCDGFPAALGRLQRDLQSRQRAAAPARSWLVGLGRTGLVAAGKKWVDGLGGRRSSSTESWEPAGHVETSPAARHSWPPNHALHGDGLEIVVCL